MGSWQLQKFSSRDEILSHNQKDLLPLRRTLFLRCFIFFPLLLLSGTSTRSLDVFYLKPIANIGATASHTYINLNARSFFPEKLKCAIK